MPQRQVGTSFDMMLGDDIGQDLISKTQEMITEFCFGRKTPCMTLELQEAVQGPGWLAPANRVAESSEKRGSFARGILSFNFIFLVLLL